MVPRQATAFHIRPHPETAASGVLAIDAHGTAVPTPPNDNFQASYGSMSNQIEFTAVVTHPNSATPEQYGLNLQRGESDAKTFLTHLGRALLVEATLQAISRSATGAARASRTSPI